MVLQSVTDESVGSLLSSRLFTWEEMEIKYKVSERHMSANEGKEGEKMGREEEK